ncbi:hypothetical protein RQP46_005491 [Phenoliferia psychrophenolica]
MKYLFAAIDARQARLAGKGGSSARVDKATQLKKLIVDASEGVDEKTSSHDFVDTLERIVNEIKNTTVRLNPFTACVVIAGHATDLACILFFPSQEHSGAFLQKVKKTEVPDYYDVIKKPMDLATLQKRVKSQMYRSKKAFADDLDLIWSNCLLYNSHPAHLLRISAEILRKKSNQLLEFISDPALPTRPMFAAALGNSQRSKAGTPVGDDGDDEGYMDGDSEDDEGGLKAHVNGRMQGGLAGVLLQNGDVRDMTDSPMASRSQTPVPGERNVLRKSRGPMGRGRSRSQSVAPENLFEDRPAIIRTPQGMQDFALLDDELERLDAALGWGPIASSSSLGLAPPPPLPSAPPLITPSPLATAPALLPSTSSTNNNTPVASSPLPLPPPPLPLSPEQARLTSLVRSLNPSAQSPIKLPNKLDDVTPPDALWWETLASASSSALGMPRCSFANHVEGDTSGPSVDPPLTKSNAKGKGKARTNTNGKGLLKSGDGKKKSVVAKKGKAVGRTKKTTSAAAKKAVNGSGVAAAPVKGLGVRMRRNFETLKDIRRLHGKLANGARGPDDPFEPVPLSSDEDDEDDPATPSSFLDTGIPPEAFESHAAEQAGRESLGIVSNRILSHAGFDGASATSVNVLAHVAAEYLMNLGRTMRFYADRYGSQMSTEQILLHVLGENGVPSPSHLEDYVSEDIDRYGAKLDGLHLKLQKAHRAQVEDVDGAAPGLDDQIFVEDSEMLMLDDLSAQTGEDFFGLAAVGLDKELGLSRLSIPLRLFRGPGPASSPLTPPLQPEFKYPPPPPHIPLTPAALEHQIGLLRPILALRQQTDAGLDDDLAILDRPKSTRAKVPTSGRIPYKGPKRKGDEPATSLIQPATRLNAKIRLAPDRMDDAKPTLSSLPLDVLVDSLLPLLPTASLNSLAQTSREWQTLIQGPNGEAVWRAKAVQDFHFPVLSTGRRRGWRELFRRLLKQSCYVWGQNANGRLGMSPNDSQTRRRLIGDGLPLPSRLNLDGATVVGLEAGGYSFHALTSTGSIISWGTMDGENWSRRGLLSEVGVCVHEPFELPATKGGAMGEVVQVEAGRKHVVARNTLGQVWEYTSFGRAYQVVDSNNAWGPGVDPVVQIEAAWQHSAVLTKSGAAFVWWQPGSAPLDRLAAEAGEASLADPTTEGVTFTLPTETVRLPSIPTPRRAANSRSPAEPADKVVSIAAGENFVIALTQSSKLYYLDISPVDIPGRPLTHHGGEDAEDCPVRGRASRARLEAAFVSGERPWQLMNRFCDMEEVRTLPVWDTEGKSKPALETRITAVSAHFKSFVVYSVPLVSGADSLVLMGDDTWTSDAVPVAIPQLQGLNVIKVVQGDYHYIALTASGHLYSWGAYSSGALGLGHPQLLNTPLSAPTPSPPSPDVAPPAQPTPYPLPGFEPQQPLPVFPGLGHGLTLPAPNRVDVPTLVRFAGEPPAEANDTNDAPRTTGKFVFAVTASGWHSGALAVELGGDGPEAAEEPEVEENEAAKQEYEREMQAGRSAGRGIFPVMRNGRLPFRLGYAARGMHRGVGQGRGGGGGATDHRMPAPES